MVVVAQLVRASDCDSEGRGFEPPRLPTTKPLLSKGFLVFSTIFALKAESKSQNKVRTFKAPFQPYDSTFKFTGLLLFVK